MKVRSKKTNASDDPAGVRSKKKASEDMVEVRSKTKEASEEDLVAVRSQTVCTTRTGPLVEEASPWQSVVEEEPPALPHVMLLVYKPCSVTQTRATTEA